MTNKRPDLQLVGGENQHNEGKPIELFSTNDSVHRAEMDAIKAELDDATEHVTSVLHRLEAKNAAQAREIAKLKLENDSLREVIDPNVLAIITEMRERIEALEIQKGMLIAQLDEAQTDPISGLSTQARFADQSEEFFEKKASENREGIEVPTFSYLMVDVDNFKPVNDRIGHVAGDIVLTKIGELIRSEFRSTSAEREGDVISSRDGGDEFSIILPNTNLAMAVIAAERLRARVDSEEFIDSVNADLYRKLGIKFPENLKITVSIGAAQVDFSRDITFSHLKQRADEGLKKVKKRGNKNGVIRFE